jgi:hypothetical protein
LGGGFQKLIKLKKYRIERRGETRIHGNSIKSVDMLKKIISITPKISIEKIWCWKGKSAPKNRYPHTLVNVRNF